MPGKYSNVLQLQSLELKNPDGLACHIHQSIPLQPVLIILGLAVVNPLCSNFDDIKGEVCSK